MLLCLKLMEIASGYPATTLVFTTISQVLQSHRNYLPPSRSLSTGSCHKLGKHHHHLVAGNQAMLRSVPSLPIRGYNDVFASRQNRAPMQYRNFGKTGLRVSDVGYGAWGIGKAMWIGADDN